MDIDVSKFYTGMQDHGDIGAEVIERDKLLQELIPDVRIYDEEVQKVIQSHSKVYPGLLDGIVLDYIKTLKNYDLAELFLVTKLDKERSTLNSVNTAIIQDVDRLDIFRKIVKGIWVPMATTDSIDPEIFELFKQRKLPLINDIKKMGKWNPNIGHLVRMNFINQMNLVPMLQKVREENLIEKVYIASGNPIVEPAYEFAKKQIDMAIENSEDGILVGKRR